MLSTIAGLVIGGCLALYAISLLETLAGTDQARGIQRFVQTLLRIDLSGVEQISTYRPMLWRAVFYFLVRAEMLWILVVVANVGPGIISNDLRHGALPIYFAKPLTPLTYVLGKFLVVATFVALVTIVPNLLVLMLGTWVSGGLETWGETFRLAAQLMASSALICVVASSVILALSSLVSDSRYVTVAWLAICLLPTAAQRILRRRLPSDTLQGWLGSISPRDDLVMLTDRMIGFRASLEQSGLARQAFERALGPEISNWHAWAVLGGLTALSLWIAWRRVVKFSQSAATV